MIKLKNVKKIYKTGKISTTALDGVSLEIKKGEMVAIMGTSGSGKTTLLNILGGMDSLTSGEYEFNDIKVSDLNISKLDRFRRENISFIFQHFALMNDYTILENVEAPLLIKGMGKANRKSAALISLKSVGIEELAKKYPNQISGGQRQRVAIARALVSENPLILADEPTGALDSATSDEIISLLRTINLKNKTVVIITHDEKVAMKCDRIIKISDGKIVE